MGDYSFQISLRIRHPAMDPARITAALGLAPFRSWKAGEPRTTPKGRPLKGKWPHSYWATPIGADQLANRRLPAAIREALDRLTPHRDFFHQVRSEGGATEFFIGWVFDGNNGDVFDCDLLAYAAGLKIDLSLDIYPSKTGLANTEALVTDE